MMNQIFRILFASLLFLQLHALPISPKNEKLHTDSLQIPPVAKRCPAKQPWSENNIARWLHQPLSLLRQVKKKRHLSDKDLCSMPSALLKKAFDKTLHPIRPDQPDAAMKFRMQQLSVHGYVKPDGLIRAFQKRKEIVRKTNQILMQRYRKYSIPTGAKNRSFNVLEASPAASSESSSAKSPATASSARVISLSRENWVPLGPDNIGGRIRTLFIHPANPDLMFAGSVGGGIWRSDDAGASWHAVDDFMANLAVTSIVADPRTTDDPDSTVLYAATGEGFYNGDALRGFGVFKSTDGGATWTHLSSTDPTTQDTDWYYVNRLAVNGNGTIVAVTRDNGIFTSTDGGSSWSKQSPGPHAYSMMEDVHFDPNNDNHCIVGSINGNVYYSTDEGQSWTESTIVNANSSWISGRVELAYAASTPNRIYASVDHNDGEIYRSDDGGQTWTYLSNPQHLSGQGWYANAIWVDPTDSNHLLIGGLDIHRSTDGGSSWNKISTWWYAPHSPHADHHVLVSDPGYDGNNNKRIYDGNDGGLYKADDITQANDGYSSNGWTNLNHGLAVTQFYGGAGISGSRIAAGAQDNGSLLQPEDNSTSGWIDTYGGDGGMSAVIHEATAGKYYYFGEYVYLMIHRSDNGASSEDIYEHGLDDAGSNANFIAPFVSDPNNEAVMLAGGASLWRSSNVNAADQDDIQWSKIKDAVSGTKISQIAIAKGDSDLILVGYNDGSIYKTTNGTSANPSWSKIHDANGKNVLALMIDKDDHNLIYAGWGGFDSGNIQKSTDGGNTWSDISSGLPQAPVRSIVRNPHRGDYLYVGTEIGVFTSEDGGDHWFAQNNGPANVSVDQLFWYDDAHLVAVTHGRGAFEARIDLKPCEEVSRPLKAYDWTLISFPCDTGDNNISALLGDSLGTYGDEANWVMYEQTGEDHYRGPNTQKRMMESNDTVKPGKGYWIITDANRTLKVNYLLPGLSEVQEMNASDLQINDANFTTLLRRRLPDSENDYKKKIIMGNPYPVTMHLSDIYFSHGNASEGYHPMSTDENESSNPNAPYIVGNVYTSDADSNDVYKAVSPDTPGFSDALDPMVGFFTILKKGQTGSNYLTLPHNQ